jgi:hypothetical protein
VQVAYDAAAPEHAAAVEAAVARARKLGQAGKSVRLVFPEGSYRCDKPGAALLNLDNLRDLVVDGGGSRVALLRYNSGLVQARKAENLAIMGFSVDFPGERTFLEGHIESADAKTGRVVVRLEPGSPGYDTPYVKRGAGASFMSLLDPKIDGRLKAGGYNAYQFEEGISASAAGSWTLTLKRPALAKYIAPGDRFVHFVREGGLPLNILFDSRNVTFYDITSYATSSLHYAGIEGSLLNVLHCRWKIAPGRWFSGNADGVHCRGYVVGPWIEHCEIQAIGDDGIALYARPASIAEAQPGGKRNACVCHGGLFNLEAGDEVSWSLPATCKTSRRSGIAANRQATL